MPNINITHDGTFDISIGRSRNEVSWKNQEWQWSTFVNKASVTHRTAESYAEYLGSKKTRQDEVKDSNGCFVGGYIVNGRRKSGNILHRQLIALDADNCAPGLWDEFIMIYGNACVCYSTHKHSPDKPRLRFVLPLDREVGTDEYEAISRRVAGNLGIENFDPTTFQPSRLMYWPSTSKDAEFFFQYQDGVFLCADEVLNSYHNWKDASEWPVSERFREQRLEAVRHAKKKNNPTELEGVVGAFCRVYTIPEAIDTFLSDVYTPCDTPDRYTYKEGSTSGGLVVYEDMFVFSNHGTDPISGKEENAYDLVRIHKFGLRDEEVPANTKFSNYPSCKAMSDFAHKDPKVKRLLALEKYAQVQSDFADELSEGASELRAPAEGVSMQPVLPFNTEWVVDLDTDKKGNNLSTMRNLELILDNDEGIRGRIVLDNFSQREGVNGDLPWRKVTPDTNIWGDRDTANLKLYIEKAHGIAGAQKIEDALKVVLEKNQYHPVKDYLNSVKWDGVHRVDTLLIEYLGAADTPYVRTVTRKMLVAAVNRIFVPGVKFEQVVVLVGDQGIGKSTLIKKLGKHWFTDNFNFDMIKGKEAAEQIQGRWIVEIGEMAGKRKADANREKNYISQEFDKYRPSYARYDIIAKRQCIFVGTTNDSDFLRDPSGDRRYWPVRLEKSLITKDVWKQFTEAEIDQVWAEALVMFRRGERLTVSREIAAAALAIQKEHSEYDERTGDIMEYLDRLLPDDWQSKDIYERRAWLKGDELQAAGTIRRDRVCVREICLECLGWRDQDIDNAKTKQIHHIMRKLDGWQGPTSMRFEGMGVQRGYERVVTHVTKTGVLAGLAV